MSEQQIGLSILAAQDGGLVIYEYINGSEQSLVFGGNLEAATLYLSSRMSRIVVQSEEPKGVSKTLGLDRSEQPKKVYALKDASADALLEKLPNR